MHNAATPHHMLFVSPTGETFAYANPTPYGDGEVLHSLDGKKFDALHVPDFSGTSDNHVLRFTNPLTGESGKLRRFSPLGIIHKGAYFFELNPNE